MPNLSKLKRPIFFVTLTQKTLKWDFLDQKNTKGKITKSQKR